MGLLTQKDAKAFRSWFKEMSFLLGIRVLYRYVVQQDVTIYSEYLPTLSDPVLLDIIFDENPKVKTLKALGWVSEDPEDKPIIAHLPYDTPNLTVNSTISIYPDTELKTRAREFRITKISSILEFPDCWTVALAPIVDTKDKKGDYSENSFNYVQTGDNSSTGTNSSSYSFINGG